MFSPTVANLPGLLLGFTHSPFGPRRGGKSCDLGGRLPPPHSESPAIAQRLGSRVSFCGFVWMASRPTRLRAA